MRNINKSSIKFNLSLSILLMLVGCSNIVQQIKEKNREDYILSNPGVYDPVVPDNPDYVTHQFRFLGKYKISHDWLYGFDICKYSVMTLQKAQRDGTWYGSYRRLGDMFEYKGVTYQEASTIGYPKGTRTSRSKDNYVRTWKKTDGLGVERKYGYKPICNQNLIGSGLAISISLYADKPKWLTKLTAKSSTDDPERYFFEKRVGDRKWLVRKKKHKPLEPRVFLPVIEQWLTPVSDTGYYYAFSLFANTDSAEHPRTRTIIEEVFKHLIKSVKIEPLSSTEAAQSREKIEELSKRIAEFEERKTMKNK